MRGRGGAETPPWAGCAAAGWLGGAAPRRLGGAARERQAHGGAEGAGAGCLGGVAASSSKGGMEEGIADTDEEEAPTKGVAAPVDSDGDGVAAPLEAATKVVLMFIQYCHPSKPYEPITECHNNVQEQPRSIEEEEDDDDDDEIDDSYLCNPLPENEHVGLFHQVKAWRP
nr:unnamed protein product [Digitaria exilis]